MKVLSFFEKIYCINLEDRVDRWEKCLEIFKKYNIDSCERVNGVKVFEQDYPYLDQKSRSQLGCALSFYRIIKKSYDNKFRNILIFEDDFYFIHSKEKTEEILNNSIESLPKEWDIFYLGANIMYDFSNNPIGSFKEHLLKLNSAYCTHSISFSKKSMSTILQKFPTENIFVNEILNNYKTIDIFFAKSFCLENYCFIPNEMICLQSPCFSSIENRYCDHSSEMLKRFENAKKIFNLKSNYFVYQE
jgi:GR25 family glycosyltransferase involved in LPS biosynthesis